MGRAEPGGLLAGRYRFRAVIRRGEMGGVWLADDALLRNEVAVRELPWARQPGPAGQESPCERAFREARAVAGLDHPSIVGVHDVVEDDGRPWMVMEPAPFRFPWCPLSDVVADEGPLPPVQAARIGLQVLSAIRVAHAAGVVHRDITPANVLAGPAGRVMLAGFGMVTADAGPAPTALEAVIGSPSYMAPERARGEPATAASDLWSLGATLYAAVEGRGPFEGQGSAMAVLANIVHADPPPATRAGPLEPVILALMKRDPAARPDATGARWLLAAACSGCRAEASASNDAQASARAEVSEAGVSEAGAHDPAGGDGGGNGATAEGGLDEHGIAGAARPASGTLPLPAFPAQNDAAFAGLPPAAAPALAVTPPPLPARPSPAALVTPSTLAASGIAPVSSTPLGRGDHSRRPGRHRRALLFGGRAR